MKRRKREGNANIQSNKRMFFIIEIYDFFVFFTTFRVPNENFLTRIENIEW